MSDDDSLQHIQLQYYKSKFLKIHSKYKKLKSLNKQLQSSNNSSTSTTTITNNHHSHLHSNTNYETLLKTLKYVLHHQQEMIECMNNILHHPIVHQSTTVQKDLEYLLAKLSHIQNKVSLATGGQTSISSPINLHSQPKLYQQLSDHKYSLSMQSSISKSNDQKRFQQRFHMNDDMQQYFFKMPPPPPPIQFYPPMSNARNVISNGYHQIGQHKRTQSVSSNSYSQNIPLFISPSIEESSKLSIIPLPNPPMRIRPKSAIYSLDFGLPSTPPISEINEEIINNSHWKMFIPDKKKKFRKRRRSSSLKNDDFDWKNKTKSRFSDEEEKSTEPLIDQQNSTSSLFYVSDFDNNHFTPSAITACGFFCTNDVQIDAEIKPHIQHTKKNSYLSYNIRKNSKIDSDTMLNIPIFDITRDRSLSSIEKRKLHIIDDLIASILENKDTYLITNALLLSFRAFTSCLLLMKVLRQRFRNPYEYVNRSNAATINKREIACKIQLGIAQMIYAWITQYWMDDFTDEVKNELKELQNDISKFIIDHKSISIIKQLIIIPINIKNNLKSNNNNLYNSSILISNEQSGKSSITDLSSDIIKEIETRWPYLSSIKAQQTSIFNNYNSETIAMQIFLMDRYVFKNIRPRELVAQAWKKKDKWEKAPHLLRMINQFNSICKWVQLSILYAGKNNNGSPFVSYAKSQSKILKFMILLAKQLLEYQDFSSLCAVHGALVSSAVKKLTSAWKMLGKKYMTMLENISRIFAWNSNELKVLHNKSRGVIVPHIGIILRDVIGIEESDKSGSYIYCNKVKMKLLAEQVERLLRWQNEKFVGKKGGINHVLQKLLLRDFLKYAHFTNQQIYQIASQKCIL